MRREISIHEVDDAVLLGEFRHLVLYLRGLDHERCEVLFGWHWGIDYYPTSKWVAEVIPLAELESKVRQVENAGLGRLGGDDLQVKVPGLECEFCFCHHSGVHLTFTPPNQIAVDFLERWQSAGLSPIETDDQSKLESGVVHPTGSA
jgi:hypothetical protein